MWRSLVIILIVNQFGICSDEAECYPPIAIDPDRPVPVQIPFEWMQAKARQAQICWNHGDVQKAENTRELFGMRSLDTLSRAGSIEGLQTFMSKADNHD